MIDWDKYQTITSEIGPYLTPDLVDKLNNNVDPDSVDCYLYLIKDYVTQQHNTNILPIAEFLIRYNNFIPSWSDIHYFSKDVYGYYFLLIVFLKDTKFFNSDKLYLYDAKVIRDRYSCISEIPFPNLPSLNVNNDIELIPNTTNKICNNCYMETIPLFHHDRFCPKCKI